MSDFQPQKFEKKWLDYWDRKKTYKVGNKKGKKMFCLSMFPYPSGDGLHVGHVRIYTGTDVLARYFRMKGYDVLNPMGWDAFGLPAENAAIKKKTNPIDLISQNIANFKRQVKMLGYSADWDREINTTDPKYYRWTQWFFIQFFKMGLLYKKKTQVYFCEHCKTGIAEEEVLADGTHERCRKPITKKELPQWIFRITDYADKLLEGLDRLDWPKGILEMQRNWIGRSEGAEVKWEVYHAPEFIETEKELSQAQKLMAPVRQRSVAIIRVGDKFVASTRKGDSNNFYYLAGGEIDPGETAQQAAERETLEEIGIGGMKFVRELGVVHTYSDYYNGQLQHEIEHYFEFSLSQEDFDKRVESEATKLGYEVKLVDGAQLRKNGWNQLNYILDNLSQNRGICGEPVFTVSTFTTRPDTLYGATFLVLAPEYAELDKIVHKDQKTAVLNYLEKVKSKTERERQIEREKSGVFTGSYAKHPLTGTLIPVWVSDYVLVGYGTGAIMAVPAHDERDMEFAKKFNLEIKMVIKSESSEEKELFTGLGVTIDSGEFSNLPSVKAKEQIIAKLEELKLGKKVVNYHLRDWIFSRQRYWGEPIPMVYCAKCAEKKLNYWKVSGESPISESVLQDEGLNGWFPIDEEQLPLKLPYLKSYEPTGDGRSPLAAVDSFVNTVCPHCGAPAVRETDTMPNWAGSCWYFLAFAEPELLDEDISTKLSKIDESITKALHSPFLPVDWYLGGAEHAVLHLLYSRFWMKALKDRGVIDFDEPFLRLRNVGMVLAEDHRKMSKSLGNVINPDDVVAKYGADTLRIYEMFMAPFNQEIPWSTKALSGPYRFLMRVWQLFNNPAYLTSEAKEEDKDLAICLAKTVRRVEQEIVRGHFNNPVAAMMEFVNEWEKEDENDQTTKRKLTMEHAGWFLQILAPYAPFITEEIWHEVLGKKDSIHLSTWPQIDKDCLKAENVIIPIQVNGKVRTAIAIKTSQIDDQKTVEKLALADEKIQRYIEGAKYRVVYVKGKIVNFVLN